MKVKLNFNGAVKSLEVITSEEARLMEYHGCYDEATSGDVNFYNVYRDEDNTFYAVLNEYTLESNLESDDDEDDFGDSIIYYETLDELMSDSYGSSKLKTKILKKKGEKYMLDALTFSGTVHEGIEVFHRVGCWYLESGQSGFICSGLNPHKTIAVYCSDGYFFVEVSDSDYPSIRRSR